MAAFFGMNLELPLVGAGAWAFPAVVGISVGLVGIAALVFYRRDWF